MRTKGDGGKAERTGGSSTARGIVMYLVIEEDEDFS